jgi:hypothetical protein
MGTLDATLADMILIGAGKTLRAYYNLTFIGFGRRSRSLLIILPLSFFLIYTHIAKNMGFSLTAACNLTSVEDYHF